MSRWRHCASTPQYASYIFTIMPRKICPFGASKIIIKMSPSALQILSAGAEFAVRGLHSVLLALPSCPVCSVQNIGGVLCAEYCQCLQPLAFLAFGPLSLIILWPLSEHFSAFDNVNPIFAIFKIFLPKSRHGPVCAAEVQQQLVTVVTRTMVARRGWWRPGPGG